MRGTPLRGSGQRDPEVAASEFPTLPSSTGSPRRCKCTAPLNQTALTTTSVGVLIEKFYDGVLAEIDLEALHLNLDLARRQALLGRYPLEFGDNVLRRPIDDPTSVAWDRDSERVHSSIE